MSNIADSRSRRFIPRSATANRSRVFHTMNWHLYLWRGQPCSNGYQSGFTVKHRRKDGLWRHVQLKKMRYSSNEAGYGVVNHFELSWHVSKTVRSSVSRVKGSKRYFRFKVCL